LSLDDVRKQFIDNRDDKSYRHAYADESLNISIATQIKVLREQRTLRQKDLAALAAMKQSMISRYENVNYSSWSINTLKKLAEAFDVVLDVRFKSFGDLVTLTQGFSRESLQVPSFDKDPYFFQGYTPSQVFRTYVCLPQGRPEKTFKVEVIYKPQLDFTPGIMIPVSNLGVVRSKNPFEPEGVRYAEEPEISSPFYGFVRGSYTESSQRPSTDWR